MSYGIRIRLGVLVGVYCEDVEVLLGLGVVYWVGICSIWDIVFDQRRKIFFIDARLRRNFASFQLLLTLLVSQFICLLLIIHLIKSRLYLLQFSIHLRKSYRCPSNIIISLFSILWFVFVSILRLIFVSNKTICLWSIRHCSLIRVLR